MSSDIPAIYSWKEGQDEYARFCKFITLLEDNSPVCQAEALNGMDKILPPLRPPYYTHDPSPEEEMLYEIIYDTGADVQLSHLLASPSDEILTLVVTVYEKIPWGSDYFTCPGLPNVDVVGTLLRRLMSPNSEVFATATRALGLFLPSHVLPEADNVILESGILRSEAFENILNLSSSSNPQIQDSVASILSRVGYLPKGANDVKACVDAGLAQALLTLLTSPHHYVRDAAASTIREFTRNDEDGQFCSAFLSANILPALVALASTMEASAAILEILEKAHEALILPDILTPDIIVVIVEQLPSRFWTTRMAEAAIRLLACKYEDAPDALVVANVIEPIIDLLSSSNYGSQEGAARAIWLIAEHENPYFVKAFLAAGVAQPLTTLLLSPNELVLVVKTVLSAIRAILMADGDGLAAKAFHDAGVQNLAPLVRNSSVSLVRATVSAINLRLDDSTLLELPWTPT